MARHGQLVIHKGETSVYALLGTVIPGLGTWGTWGMSLLWAYLGWSLPSVLVQSLEVAPRMERCQPGLIVPRER